MPPRPDDAALAATLATIDQRATIRPAGLDATLPSETGVAARADLEPLSQRLVLGTTIGEGGMAVVRIAKQTSLGREVAVKALRSDATDAASPRMLREAWITGALEHPNIVPVHDLGADERGRPMLVLKRIEGKPWSDLIGQRDEIRSRFGMDALEWNLQQLVHVCHAIAFAHSRGIVHRDLKPANIMIGGFGEVYVLDWGIAVSLVDDGSGRLPLAADCQEMAGTLAYMAPEMLGSTPLTERTDVYLLGAILYEIATGEPPHLRESIGRTIESITSDPIVMTPDVPDELTSICKRALAKIPGDRYASADELRTAIVGFLEHRGSAEIAREAHRQLRDLQAHLATNTSTGAARDDVDDRVKTYQLFGQSRFGFQAALRAWPDNKDARAGLDHALTLMATYELDHGDERAAAVLIAELATPVPELAARLVRAQRAAAEKTERFARFEADQDVALASLTRTLFLVVIGLAWATLPILATLLPAIEVDHGTSLIVAGVSVTAIIGFAAASRGAMTRTSWNRGAFMTVLLSIVLHAVCEAVAWAMGLDMVVTHMMSISLWSGACGIAAVFLDRALLLPAIGFLGAVAATVWMPAHRFWAISASCGFLLTVIVFIYHQGQRGRRIAGLAELLRSDT